MAGEEQPGGWEPAGWPGGYVRLLMVDPDVRLMVDVGPTWRVWIGWPGVTGLARKGRAADEAGAMRAAESAAAVLLREMGGRVADALDALDARAGSGA